MLTLYMHPISTVSRPVSLFIAEKELPVTEKVLDLMAGEHKGAGYLAINPNGQVPSLAEGDFRMAESSAILKYLASRFDCPEYPKDLKERAKVDEAMDWFNTNLYRDFGYGLLYPQILPHYKNEDQKVQNAIISAGRERAKKWLGVLDANIIGPAHGYVCGNTISIADYLGAAIVTTGEVIRLDYSAYPNIQRWLANMKALRTWKSVNEGFYTHFVAPYKDTPFQGL